MTKPVEEKRKYLRLNVPVEIGYLLPGSDRIYTAVTKDISASGIRFETVENFQNGLGLELTLKLPNIQNPVHVYGKIAWQEKSNRKDGVFTDVGIEFVKVEEDNKNTFLKYLCDLIYG